MILAKNKKIVIYIAIIIILWFALGNITKLLTSKQNDGVKPNITQVDISKDGSSERGNLEKDNLEGGGLENSSLKKLQVMHIEAGTHTPKTILKGVTLFRQDIAIKPEVSGKVEQILRREGESVKKGEVILTIEERSAYARLNYAEANMKQKEIDYASASRLSRDGYGSRNNLKQAEALLQQAKAELIEAKMNYDNLKVTSPIDGVIEAINIETGQFVINAKSFGSEGAVARVINRDSLVAIAHIAQNKIGNLAQNDAVELKNINGKLGRGYVKYISKSADANTRSFKIEVAITQGKGNFLGGETIEMVISHEPVLAYKIPLSSILLNENGEVGVKYIADMNNMDNINNAGNIAELDDVKEHQGRVAFRSIKIDGVKSGYIFIEARSLLGNSDSPEDKEPKFKAEQSKEEQSKGKQPNDGGALPEKHSPIFYLITRGAEFVKTGEEVRFALVKN